MGNSATNLVLVTIANALETVALPALQRLGAPPTAKQSAAIYKRFKANVLARLQTRSEPIGLESLYLTFSRQYSLDAIFLTFSAMYGRIGPEQMIVQIDKYLNNCLVVENNTSTGKTIGNNTAVDTDGGDVVGAAIGTSTRVRAKGISKTRERPPQVPLGDGLAAVLKAARELLAKESTDADERGEAEGAIHKIEKELTKPSPNTKMVYCWLITLEAASETAGQVLRNAHAIAALLR